MKAFLTNPWKNAIVWGLTGSVLMVISRFLPVDATWKSEIPMMISFAGCLFAVYYSIRVPQNKRKFVVIFLASLLAWMMMFILPHIVLAFVFGGYGNFWWLVPIFEALGLGVLFCAPLSLLTMKLRKNSVVPVSHP